MSSQRGLKTWLRYAVVVLGGALGFFASIGAAARRFERVARAWNKASPFANPGLKIGRRRYLLHAPHQLRAPGHQGKWHWEAKAGPVPLWHRRKFRVWERFF